MSTYATDENGKIPKVNDHTIDCLRYIFRAAQIHTLPKTLIIRDTDDSRICVEEDEYEEDLTPNMYEFEEEFL